MKLYIDQYGNAVFGNDGMMYPLSYYSDILNISEKHIFDVPAEKVVNFLIKQIDSGNYVILDLNYKRIIFPDIIQFPVPILKGNTEVLKSVRTKLYEPQFSELTVVDFTDLAQGCKTYDEFIGKMAITSENELKYIGIAICGNKKHVNKLTGSLPLLR